MTNKYYDDTGKQLSAYSSFTLLDKNGKSIQNYPNNPCYGAITGTINKNTAAIDVYRSKNSVPYTEEGIVRYVYDLNDMGFPVSFINKAKDTYHFHVYMENYKSKTHMFSTLTLLRMLWESPMHKVPLLYFKMMDEYPQRDKLDAIQAAHKSKGNYTGGGHCVTYAGNGGNIDKETLFARFNKGTGVFTSGGLAINAAWKGVDPCPMVNTCRDCIYKRQHGIYP